ncbi:MAG TPA: ABC transporter ATP-binding protein [Acidimicrobiales bacterium]|nr:ABC transporter ATP-binding protein [Acidimicrobiales bacterium]
MARVVVGREVTAEELTAVLAGRLGPRARIAVEGGTRSNGTRLGVRRGALAAAVVHLVPAGGRSELRIRGAGWSLLLRAVNELGIARSVARILRTAPELGSGAAAPAGRAGEGETRVGGPARDGHRLALELRGVHRHYGSVEAVAGIDLTVRIGEVVAYLGPNGAGKTTTIDMILGLARPSAGSVAVLGLDPAEAVRRGLVSAVMQAGGLLKDLTVAETVEYASLLFPATRPVDEVMARAGLDGIADRRVGRCSGGEQQRLRFAMALLPDPQLLVLDEPTQGMDVEARREFWSAIREDAAAGRTILFATHYLEEADAHADRIVVLSRGRIVADGTPAEVKAMAAGRTVRARLKGAKRDELAGLLGTDVEVRGETVIVQTSDSDAVARRLLNETAAFDLEITAQGLEDAFVALTGGDQAAPPATLGPERDH